MSVTSTMAKCGIYDAQMPHLATVNTAFTPRKCRTYENAPTLTLCERHHPAWQTAKATTTNRQAVRETGKDWCHKTFGSFGEKHYLCTAKCACGGIGRRARLRIWCLATCRFESCQAHSTSFTYKAERLFCVHVGISVQGRLLPVLWGSVASKKRATYQGHSGHQWSVRHGKIKLQRISLNGQGLMPLFNGKAVWGTEEILSRTGVILQN